MTTADFSLEPTFLKLHYGGWLATSAPTTKIRIGVIGASQEEARALFTAALRRWKELFESEEA